jgi:hypothetical protein
MPETPSQESPKARRVSIDLTPAAAAEVDRLRSLTELTTADMFRFALHLFRMYVDERTRGNVLYLGNADNPTVNQTRIELPLDLPVKRSQAQSDSSVHS